MGDDICKNPPQRSDSSASITTSGASITTSKSSGYATAEPTPIEEKSEEEVFSGNSTIQNSTSKSFMLPTGICADYNPIPTFLDDMKTTHLQPVIMSSIENVIRGPAMPAPVVVTSDSIKATGKTTEDSIKANLYLLDQYNLPSGESGETLSAKESRLSHAILKARHQQFEKHEANIFPEDKLIDLCVGIQCSEPDCRRTACKVGQKMFGTIYAGLAKGLDMQPPVTRACWDHAMCCGELKCYIPFCLDFRYWNWLSGLQYDDAFSKLVDKYGIPPKGFIPEGSEIEVTQIASDQHDRLTSLQERVHFYPELVIGKFGQVCFGNVNPIERRKIAVKVNGSPTEHILDIAEKLRNNVHDISSTMMALFKYKLTSSAGHERPVSLIVTKQFDYTLKRLRDNIFPSGMDAGLDFKRIMSQVLDANTYLINQTIVNHIWDVDHIGCCNLRSNRKDSIVIKLFNFSGAVTRQHLTDKKEESMKQLRNAISPLYWPEEFFHKPGSVFPYSVIWMLGLLIYELASCQRPRHEFLHDTREDMQRHIQESPNIELSRVSCTKLREIVSGCCKANTSERLHLPVLKERINDCYN